MRAKKAKLGPKVDENQQFIDGMLNKTQKYPKTSSRQKQLNNCLLDMLAKDLQLVSVVEDKGFINFVNLLDPRFEIPSRRAVMRMLPTKYDELKQRILRVLVQVKYVSLTTDLWTSRATEGYLTVTAHFIHSWKLKSLVLATVKFSAEHTAEHIAVELQKVTEEWGIMSKVAAIVTDNTSNMVAAIRITGWTHIHCFSHTLNLVVQEAIKGDSDLRKSVKIL